MGAARRPSSWFALELTHKMKRTYAGIAGEEPIVSEFDGILGRRTRIVEHLARFRARVVHDGVDVGAVRPPDRATEAEGVDTGEPDGARCQHRLQRHERIRGLAPTHDVVHSRSPRNSGPRGS